MGMLRRFMSWCSAQTRRASRRRREHQRNIRRAADVLREIRSWQAPQPGARILGYLRRCSPYVIEELVLSCLAEQGCRIERNPRYTGDGGIDGRVALDGKPCLIQVKRYRSHIRLADVQQFARLIRRDPEAMGFFVHTGRTGAGVRAFVRKTNILVVSGQTLADLATGRPVRFIVGRGRT